ncbi:amino acid ABC transporter permease [Georgenia sp. Z1491]|uniref:amino acid ABC transporter permease n=1 Tax=Georgenia sp. Z1491 TaxID=3416707 RepID=UPI003CEF8ED8
MSDNLDAVVGALPQLWEGVLITLQLTVGGIIGAFVIAIVLGLVVRSERWYLRVPARLLIEFFRGISLLVLLYVLFYVLPLFGVTFTGLFCGIFALSFNYGAYGAEVVRGAINNVPKGQWEVGTALSISPLHHMRRVIWPQAWAIMLPSLSNLAVMLLKGTAVAYIILMHDLTWQTDILRSQTGSTFFSYGVGMVIYFLISLVIVLLAQLLERQAKRKLGQGAPMKEMFDVQVAKPNPVVSGE